MKIMLPILIAVFCIYAVLKTSLDSRMLERRLQLDVRYFPTPETVQFLAAGYKSALSDTIWIESLNYFGTELGNKHRSFKYMNDYLNLILHLDPLFRMFYEWAATIFIYNALPITRNSILESQRYINLGIQNLSKKGIYDQNIISKGAFNYAFEAFDFDDSIPFFEMAARISPKKRDFLLIASSYAQLAKDDETAARLKLEFLTFSTFEAQKPEDLRYAIQVITSREFNAQGANYIKAYRLQMESDEKVKELIQRRFESSPILREKGFEGDQLNADPRIENLMKVDFSRNWLNPDLHLLLSL